MKAATHPDEKRRLDALLRYQILDTEPERAFDDVVQLVSQICDVPIAVVNFIDSDRQWFKAEVGLGVRSTPLETSLCSHVILEGAFVEIPDTLNDDRMRDNPLCAGDTGLRFYAGATLRTDDGLPLGTLCVLDHKPRVLTDLQRRAVTVLAEQVMRQLDLRNAVRGQEMLRREIDHRVKNSLASVSALVTIQANRSPDIAVKQALGAVQARLSALVSLHEELQQAGDGATVDLKRFLERLAGLLQSLLPDGVALETDVPSESIDAVTANSIGIVINEFVANSGKHAFPDETVGTVSITVRHADQALTLRCADNGVGGPETLASIKQSKNLGSRVIAASVAAMHGSSLWEPVSGGGVAMTVTIPR